MTVEELNVIIRAQTSGFTQGMRQVQSSLNNIQNSVRSMTSGIQRNMTNSLSGVQSATNNALSNILGAFSKFKSILIALGIAKILKDSFNIARTYEASVQQVNRLFGAYASAMDSWIEKNATMFGMARADAMKYSAVYGNLLSGFLRTQGEMAAKTQDLLKYTTIIAASTGRTVEDVSERIRSGLLGNTEAIEDLGINVNVALLKTSDAFKQLANGRKWEQLNFQTQQQIRLMAILEQASAKFGDSIQNNTNYQLMQLTAQLKNIGLNIGQAFMPIVSVVLPILNAFALALANVTRYIAQFMNALFGTNFTKGAGVSQVAVDAGKAAGGLGTMADNAEEAGEAVKKAGKTAKGALASFDEVNTLAKDTGSGGAGGTAGGAGGELADTLLPEESAMESAIQSFAEKVKARLAELKGLFKEGFDIGFKTANLDALMGAVQRLKEALEKLFGDGKIEAAFKDWVDRWVKSLGTIFGSILSIGSTIATNLIGGIADYIDTNKDYIQERILNIFELSAQIGEKLASISVTIADIFSVFGGETAQKITSNIMGIFGNTFLGLVELAHRGVNDVLAVIDTVLSENKEKIKTALENTLKPIESITQTLETFVTNTFKKIFETYDQYISPAFKNIAQGLSELVGAILDAYNTYIAPVLDEWADKFRVLFEDHIQPLVDSAIEFLGKLALAFSELFKNVIVPYLKDVIETWAPRIQFILQVIGDVVGVVITLIVQEIQKIIDILSGVLDFLSSVFKGDWEGAWNSIKEIDEKFQEATSKQIEAIKGFFGDLVGHVGGFIKDQWNKALDESNQKAASFKEDVSYLLGAVKTKFSEIGSYISGTFKSTWNSVWTSVGTKFDEIWNKIGNKARSTLNNIIDHLNRFINGINNKLRFKFPDLMGGGEVSFKIPNIPRLARGGIIDSPTIAMMGEAGKEAVVPLENTSFVQTMASAISNSLAQTLSIILDTQPTAYGKSDNRPIIIEIDGKQIARATAPQYIQEFKRRGIGVVV